MENAPPVPSPDRPDAFIVRRLLSLLYDLFAAFPLWLLIAVPFVLLDVAVSGDVRHNIGPFSAMQWLLWLCCWIATGLYATISWQRGGQTLGMRAWRLRVVSRDGAPLPATLLWKRYLVGTASLLAAGAGFWWASIDRDHLTWHDRAAGTRLVRVPKGQAR